MTPALSAAAERAIQVVTADGRRYSGGRAMLFALETVGWHPTWARWGRRRPFVWAVEAGYRVVARNRAFFSRFLFRDEGDDGA